MDTLPLSQRARRRLLIAALVGAGSYAAYRAWRDNERVKQACRRTVSELQRCSEAALTRATACVVAGTIQGIAAVRPQAVDVPAPEQPWQAMALEKLMTLLTSRAGMDLVSLAVAVGAQHSTAAFCQHWSAMQRQAAAATQQPNGAQPQQHAGPTNGKSAHGTSGGAIGSSEHRSNCSSAPGTPQRSNGSSTAGSNGSNGRSRHSTEAASGNGHPGHAGSNQQPLSVAASPGNVIIAQLLAWASTPQGMQFAVAAVAAAARSSTHAYMSSLGAGNSYDDIFAAAFRPEHRGVLRDLTQLATREAVATYLCPNRVRGSSRGLTPPTAYIEIAPAHKHGSSASWSESLTNLSLGASALVKAVSNNSKTAVYAIPVLVLASSRGLALGCKDAVLARMRFGGSSAGELLPSGGRMLAAFDNAFKSAWTIISLLVVMIMAGAGLRTLYSPESMLTLHA